MSMINIVGVLGVGKSTLVKRLAKEYNFKSIVEPALGENPYLEDFYKNPKAYAFAMQFYLLGNRFTKHMDASKDILLSGKHYITDLGYSFDTSYAIVNHQLGNISDRDMETYHKVMDYVLREGMPSRLNIYLKVPIPLVLERIKERARGCETGVEASYLEALEEQHFIRMEHIKILHGTPYIEVDYSDFESGYNKVVRILTIFGFIKGDK